MMTTQHTALYNGGKENQEFLDGIKEANNDNPPIYFDSDITKMVFAVIYYGWLVGKYGKKWESNI